MANEIGTRLRRARHELKLPMSHMARKLGVSVMYISDIERGNRVPVGRLREIATAYGIPDMDLTCPTCHGKGVL